MADTKPIHVLDGTTYVSANTLTTIPIGAGMVIQNQSRNYVKLAVSASQPDVETSAFMLVPPNAAYPATITGETNSVWLLGNGPVSIQEA